MTLVVRVVPWDDPVGAALRTAQQAEVSARYGVPDSEPGPKPTAADIAVFFVAFDEPDTAEGAEAAEADSARSAGTEIAVGCGGLRTLDDAHGEIKRMYVVPERRGTGVATALLTALEGEARGRGWERLVLETGDRQLDAVRLYEREGYTRIPNFGYYADSALSICYEKRLAPLST